MYDGCSIVYNCSRGTYRARNVLLRFLLSGAPAHFLVVELLD